MSNVTPALHKAMKQYSVMEPAASQLPYYTLHQQERDLNDDKGHGGRFSRIDQELANYFHPANRR